jgi:hypothetical protein
VEPQKNRKGRDCTKGGKDRKVLKSIEETKKLFTVEGIAEGKANVVVSKYLLSLPENKQREVLNEHLDRLVIDLARYERGEPAAVRSEENEISKTQLRLMIQVVESLLAQI